MTKAITIAAPQERVWGAFQDLDRYVRMLEPHVLSLELTPPGPLAIGQKIHAKVRAGRMTVEAYSEITEIVPMRRIVETHVPNDFFKRMVEIHTLEAVPGGTSVIISVYYQTRGLRAKVLDLVFARRALSRNFGTTMSNLKTSLESQTAVTR
jgi:uncharacterized membrane protein